MHLNRLGVVALPIVAARGKRCSMLVFQSSLRLFPSL